MDNGNRTTLLREYTAAAIAPVRPRRRRRVLRWLVVLAVLVVILPLLLVVTGTFSALLNPFRGQDIDRSTPALVTQLQDMARFQAATGTFQVLVDVEHDTSNLPSVISGERSTFFATGTVDAAVDFSALDAAHVTPTPDRSSVTIALPAPVLGAAVIDPTRSRVVGHQRGLVQRLGDAIGDAAPGDDEQELYALAAHKIDVAAQQSDLLARAEQNTRSTLTGLAGSLGFTQVTVTFAAVSDQR